MKYVRYVLPEAMRKGAHRARPSKTRRTLDALTTAIAVIFIASTVTALVLLLKGAL